MSSEDHKTVGERLDAQLQERRERIEKHFWPKARLLFEIFYQQINRNNTFSLAAALTYKTLFSLLPIFVLTLLILSSIPIGGGEGAGTSTLDRSVRQFLFSQLSLNQLPVTGTNGQPLIDPATHKQATAAELVAPMLQRAQASITTTATGVVTLGVVLYGATTLIMMMESAFNQIYGAVKSRKWWVRLILYVCVLMVGPIGIAASVMLGRYAYNQATQVAGVGALLSVLVFLASLIVSWFVACLLFKIIPHTRVHWKSAMVGALVAAVSWELGKWGFDLYVQTALRTSWYGSLVLLPLFMTWIYLTWTVILMGLEVAYLLQYYPMLRRHYFSTGGTARVSDVRWVLLLGIMLYERYCEGPHAGIRADEAARVLMIPNDVSERLLLALEAGGLVVENGQGYRLAVGPEKITAYDLLLAGRAFCQVPPELAGEGRRPGLPVAGALHELEELQVGWAKKRTLVDLAGKC